MIRTTEEAIRRNRIADPLTRRLEDLLLGFGLLRDGKLLNGALVLFGRGERLAPLFPQCTLRMARFRGRDADRRGIGTRPESPLVDFATVARGFGMAAEGPIESPGELPAALARGVRAVAEGRPYLLDVVTGVR